ncbi:MAG TPA: hypothetical protein VHY55_05905, partial [Acidimicrobiia bacterium]|nr:hypothetical protein [Acidimicrobiia bacterium]
MLTICTSGLDEEDEPEEDELEEPDDDELPPPLAPLPPFCPPKALPVAPDPPAFEPVDADEFPEPVADPVVEVPPVPFPASCSPAVTLTCDTTPSNVATSDAPLNPVCAFVSW